MAKRPPKKRKSAPQAKRRGAPPGGRKRTAKAPKKETALLNTLPEFERFAEESWSEGIQNLCGRILGERGEYLELLTAAYLKLTDVPPDQAELVEEEYNGRVVWYFRRRFG